MILKKNIKIFVISVISLAVYVQAKSISQIGDIHIERSNVLFQCDMIKCPPKTDRCYVSKTIEEPSLLKRTNICYSRGNQTLAEKVTTSATDPKNRISIHVNAYRNGRISTVDNNFDEEQFKKNLDSHLSGVNEGLKRLHGNLNKMHQDRESKLEQQMKKLNEDLKRKQQDRESKLEQQMKKLNEDLKRKQQDRESKLEQQMKKLNEDLNRRHHNLY